MAHSSNTAAFLDAKVQELRVRKGPYSVIVQTLEAALRSGTDEDLRRGRVAFDIWQQTGEQRRLADIPRAQPKPSPISEPPKSAHKREELRAWAKAVEKRMAASKKVFNEDYSSPSSEGTDFSKRDAVSASGMRHLLASRKRPKLRPKPRPKPRRK